MTWPTPWEGTFEAHLTVDAPDADARARFVAWCEAHGVKCVLIELARGTHASQPMTASHHRGELARDVAPAIAALRARVIAAGFPVVRTKIEALALDGAPADDDAAAAAPGYFEFHAKLRLAPDHDRAALLEACARHRAHLSRNDRKRAEPGGAAERFVTLRVHARGRVPAEAAFDALLADLAAIGHAPIGTKREYTVYDERVELDAGWLPA